ncbi:MAG: hypothetical protein EOM52_04100 [Clostridia bacterium]|nr:hypothetical protein [Clostridia bacterium]
MAKKDDLPRYTMRLAPALLKKLHYVAAYDGRSVNKELEILVRDYIEKFEAKNGKIDINAVREIVEE